MQRHEPRTPELGLADGEDAGSEIDVVSTQTDHFTEPHARYREESKHGLVGFRLQSRLEPSIRLQQTTDVGVGPQVRRRAALVSAEDVAWRWRHFGGWVDRFQVHREAAGRSQAMRPVEWLHAFRQLRPGNDQISRQRRRAGGVVIRKELREQMAWPLEFETQRPTQPEVVVYVACQIAHEPDPPAMVARFAAIPQDPLGRR